MFIVFVLEERHTYQALEKYEVMFRVKATENIFTPLAGCLLLFDQRFTVLYQFVYI